jgi:hypothetical protein
MKGGEANEDGDMAGSNKGDEKGGASYGIGPYPGPETQQERLTRAMSMAISTASASTASASTASAPTLGPEEGSEATKRDEANKDGNEAGEDPEKSKKAEADEFDKLFDEMEDNDRSDRADAEPAKASPDIEFNEQEVCKGSKNIRPMQYFLKFAVGDYPTHLSRREVWSALNTEQRNNVCELTNCYNQKVKKVNKTEGC